MSPHKDVELLLAEDNPGDVWLVREALKEGRAGARLHVVENGEEALAYLRREGKYAGAARPKLVLLDLNMPKKGGREVLAEMRSDPGLDCIPVVILTGSEREEDIVNSYKLHANCYVAKPAGAEHFTATVKSIEKFWLDVAELPPHCSAK